jgi:hypothetical protein
MLLTPLRSRQAPARGNGGAFDPTVGAERTLANPQPRWLVRAPSREPRPYGDSASFNRPVGGTPTHTPDRSGTEPKCSFRPAAGPRASPLPVRSAALRREVNGSTARQASRKTQPSPSRSFAVWERPHGRQPAPDDRRPLREAIARGLSATTRRSSLSRSSLERTRRFNQENRTARQSDAFAYRHQSERTCRRSQSKS